MKSITEISGTRPALTDADAAADSSLERQLAELLAAHGAALRRVASGYAQGNIDRDDLLQDIAMALWQALPRFRGECSERTFVFRIAHNRGISHYSRRKPNIPLREQDVEQGEEGQSDSSEFKLSQEQLRRGLLHAIHQLPIIYREVIVLSLEGLEYREIAQIVGISESNVGVRVNRARGLLKTLMKEHL